MQLLRTIIRFLIILIALGLLVFLSVTIFKFIPKAINQLASATISFGNRQSTSQATTTVNSERVAEPAPVTENGLNGVYSKSGDIIILDTATKTPAVKKTVSIPQTRTYTQTQTKSTSNYFNNYYINEPLAERSLSGGKNLKVTFSAIGIIQNGQFISTNTFNTGDTISMRFMVLNEEDTPTGPWSMRVEMPAYDINDRVRVLNNLDSVPGESSYIAEARFTGINISNGTPIIRVFLDIYNQVAERNENDNTLSLEMRNINSNIYNNNYYDNNNYNNCNYYNNYDCNNNSSYTPNLSITSFETGRLLNGIFYPQTSINYGERLAIRAHVKNTGGWFNNTYSTRISLLDSNGNSRDFSTGSESGLSQNSESILTHEIDGLTRGTNRITYTIDTQNTVNESNESDNVLQTTVQVN